jgi:hypothetical protein
MSGVSMRCSACPRRVQNLLRGRSDLGRSIASTNEIAEAVNHRPACDPEKRTFTIASAAHTTATVRPKLRSELRLTRSSLMRRSCVLLFDCALALPIRTPRGHHAAYSTQPRVGRCSRPGYTPSRVMSTLSGSLSAQLGGTVGHHSASFRAPAPASASPPERVCPKKARSAVNARTRRRELSHSLLNLAERDGRASYPQFTARRRAPT